MNWFYIVSGAALVLGGTFGLGAWTARWYDDRHRPSLVLGAL